MVGQGGIGCVMEVTAYMDGTETEISGEAGHRHATLGSIQTYRVHGGRCYNMNDGGHAVCGNSPNLLVEQMPKTCFDFLVCGDQASPGCRGRISCEIAHHPVQLNIFQTAFFTSLAVRTRPLRSPGPHSRRAKHLERGDTDSLSKMTYQEAFRLRISAAICLHRDNTIHSSIP